MARVKIEKNISYDDIRDMYYVTLYYGTDSEGKIIKKTETFKKKRDAQNRLKEFEGAKLKNDVVLPRNDTLGSWLDYWMENVVKVNREKTTYAGYSFIIEKHIKPSLGDIKLQKVTPAILQSYYTEKQTKGDENGKAILSSNTVKKHHTLLKTALKFAHMQGAIHSNPADKVSPPKYVKPEISFYTVDDMKQLFELIDDEYVLKPAVYLAGILGLRREEIAGLKWINVDFDNKIVYIKEVRARADNEVVVKKTKNESSTRKLAMNGTLEIKLREILEAQKASNEFLGNSYIDSGYVVVNEYGKEINPGYLSSLFGRFVKKNNLPHITLHGLRHTIASIGNDAGLTMFEISKILGHSSPDVTGRVYMHVFDDSHIESMERIEDILYSQDVEKNVKI